MNRGKKILVLSIGFFLVTLTAAALIIWLIPRAKADYSQHPDLFDLREIVVGFSVLFFSPIILEELTLLRSVYKLLFFHPGTAAKVCYILSAIVLFLTLVFHILFLTLNNPYDGYALFSWPIILVSFLLGSVPCSSAKTLDP